jgi:hypothetical protein
MTSFLKRPSYSPMPSLAKLASPALSSDSAFSTTTMDEYRGDSSLSLTRIIPEKEDG